MRVGYGFDGKSSKKLKYCNDCRWNLQVSSIIQSVGLAQPMYTLPVSLLFSVMLGMIAIAYKLKNIGNMT